MLNKRTNLLLNEEDYRLLVALATIKGISMGELIRQAVKKQYREQFRKIKRSSTEREKAVAEIISFWQGKKLPKRINYKKLIELGRKY